MKGVVWGLRWRLAMSRRRLLAWNIIVPIVLLLPVAASPAAAPHRAAVLGVFIVFFGTFGSCIPLVRDRARGWNEKVTLTGYGFRPWLSQRIAAEAAIDLVELTPALLLVFVIVGGSLATGPGSMVSALPSVALALLAANLLGAIVAAIVVSIAEAALACGAVALFALHFSGLFRSAAPDTWAGQLERFGVFRPLVQILRDGLSGNDPIGYGLVGWLEPLVALSVLSFLALSVSPRLARRSGGAS
jgi:hypothetical protein